MGWIWIWIWSRFLSHSQLPFKDKQAYSIINVCTFWHSSERDADGVRCPSQAPIPLKGDSLVNYPDKLSDFPRVVSCQGDSSVSYPDTLSDFPWVWCLIRETHQAVPWTSCLTCPESSVFSGRLIKQLPRQVARANVCGHVAWSL